MTNPNSVAFSIRKNNWCNPNVFPDLLYLDANPIIDMKDNRTYGELITDYIIELVNKGGMITWSSHTEQEVRDYIHVNVYSEHAEQNNIISPYDNGLNWKYAEDTVDSRTSILLARKIDCQAVSVFKRLENFGLPLEESNISVNKLNCFTKAINSTFGGSSKDAKHIALANMGEVNNILSNDSGMLRYDSHNVFGASRNIVSSSNSNQLNLPFRDLESLCNQRT